MVSILYKLWAFFPQCHSAEDTEGGLYLKELLHLENAN